MTDRYFGMYRGKVTNNVDPAGLHRIKATVAQVFGPNLECNWASPCWPPGWLGGNFVTGSGGDPQGGSVTVISTPVILVPAIGAGVWIAFEGGDRDYPVWMGGWT